MRDEKPLYVSCSNMLSGPYCESYLLTTRAKLVKRQYVCPRCYPEVVIHELTGADWSIPL